MTYVTVYLLWMCAVPIKSKIDKVIQFENRLNKRWGWNAAHLNKTEMKYWLVNSMFALFSVYRCLLHCRKVPLFAHQYINTLIILGKLIIIACITNEICTQTFIYNFVTFESCDWRTRAKIDTCSIHERKKTLKKRNKSQLITWKKPHYFKLKELIGVTIIVVWCLFMFHICFFEFCFTFCHAPHYYYCISLLC